MAFFQWQRIDPTPAEVEAALCEAHHPADGAPADHEFRDALERARRTASGSVHWDSRRKIACYWWTDHADRKHWYVEGDFYIPNDSQCHLWRCRREAAHPLCVIDPLHAVIRGDRSVLFVCDCGEVGTPEELGWAGDCCGPCSDRCAEGLGVSERLAVHAHRWEVRDLDFTEDGRVLSISYGDGSVHRFDPGRGEGSLLVEPSNRGGAGVAALPGNRVAVAFTRAEVVCLDVDSGAQLWQAHCAGEVMGLAASPAGDWLAVEMDDEPYLIAAATGKVGRGPRHASDLAFGPDGMLFAFDSDYGGVIAVGIETGETWETKLMLDDPEDCCFGLACSPAGLLAAGGEYGGVRIGDPAAGLWLHVLERPGGQVMYLDFTPDGDVLATDHDDAVVFWDVRAGRERGSLALPIGGSVCALAFSPDGELIAVGDGHGVIRLWPWRRLLSV